METEYNIIEGEYNFTIDRVNHFLAEGWMLHGNLVVTSIVLPNGDIRNNCYQAMVR